MIRFLPHDNPYGCATPFRHWERSIRRGWERQLISETDYNPPPFNKKKTHIYNKQNNFIQTQKGEKSDDESGTIFSPTRKLEKKEQDK